MSEKIIVALDSQDSSETDQLLASLKGTCHYFKVGMQAYYSQGSKLIEKIKNQQAKVFLDLKLHDIPSTVKKSLAVLNKLEIDMINIHTLGGVDMMKAARDAITSPTQLIGVTMLTSHNPSYSEQFLFSAVNTEHMAKHLAKLAYECDLSGVVCSPLEVQGIKDACSSEFLCVTPGVRPAGSEHQDQQRVSTPSEAVRLGSDYLVIGRPITQARDPKQSFENIAKEIR